MCTERRLRGKTSSLVRIWFTLFWGRDDGYKGIISFTQYLLWKCVFCGLFDSCILMEWTLYISWSKWPLAVAVVMHIILEKMISSIPCHDIEFYIMIFFWKVERTWENAQQCRYQAKSDFFFRVRWLFKWQILWICG